MRAWDAEFSIMEDMDPVRVDVSSYEEAAALLYGDGAWEMVAKAVDPARAKRERTEARIGLATNVIGIAAGTAGTAAATTAFKDQFRSGKPKAPKAPGKVAQGVKAVGRLKPVAAAGRQIAARPKTVAGAALGLQGANLAGDFVANRVLARGAKNPDKVKKSHSLPEAKGRLVQTTTNATFKGAQKAPGLLKELKQKTIKKSYDFTFSGELTEVSKSIDDKRQVFGWASIVEMNGEPVVDLQGDYLPLDVIEKAAYDYVLESRKGGDMHRRNGDEPHHTSDLIESFLVTPEKKKAMGLPEETPVGWWCGFKVNDDELWQLVKDGKRPGFSIHGSGQRVEKVLS